MILHPSPLPRLFLLVCLSLVTLYFVGCMGIPGSGGKGLGMRENGNQSTVVFGDGDYKDVHVEIKHDGDNTQAAEKTVDAGKLSSNPSITGQGTASTTGNADVGGQVNGTKPAAGDIVDPQLAATRQETADVLAKTKADAAVIAEYRHRLAATTAAPSASPSAPADQSRPSAAPVAGDASAPDGKESPNGVAP